MIRAGLVLSLMVVSGVGCGRSHEGDAKMPGSPQHLFAIRSAYFSATEEIGRPPEDLAEIMPFLRKQGDPAVLLKSPDDGEPYVIHWGIDLRAASGVVPVVAYEKKGKDGKRFVLLYITPLQLTDEEFKKLSFPAGKQP